MKKTCIAQCRCQNLGKLVLRLFLGILFVYHGWEHLSKISMTIAFFGHLGLPPFVAYATGAIELLGGVLVLLGIWTRLATLGFIVVMLGVFFSVHMGQGGFLLGHEYEFSLFSAALALALLGPGTYSFHHGDRSFGFWGWLSGGTCNCECGCENGAVGK